MINPIVYNDADQVFIDSLLERADFTHNFWNKNTPKKMNRPAPFEKQIETIKTAIKQFYRVEQHHKCVYCNYTYPSTHGTTWWTDHIIPKSLNKNLMFEPQNLCVSCVDCNRIKGNKQVFNDDTRTDFSDVGDDYKIIHPHFDIYEEHLEEELFLYTAKNNSLKGCETIIICELTRFLGMALDGEQRSTDLMSFYDSTDVSDSDFDELIIEFGENFL